MIQKVYYLDFTKASFRSSFSGYDASIEARSLVVEAGKTFVRKEISSLELRKASFDTSIATEAEHRALQKEGKYGKR